MKPAPPADKIAANALETAARARPAQAAKIRPYKTASATRPEKMNAAQIAGPTSALLKPMWFADSVTAATAYAQNKNHAQPAPTIAVIVRIRVLKSTTPPAAKMQLFKNAYASPISIAAATNGTDYASTRPRSVKREPSAVPGAVRTDHTTSPLNANVTLIALKPGIVATTCVSNA